MFPTVLLMEVYMFLISWGWRAGFTLGGGHRASAHFPPPGGMEGGEKGEGKGVKRFGSPGYLFLHNY